MRGRWPSRTVSDPSAVWLKAGHTLTVTETALAFLEDIRRRGDLRNDCVPAHLSAAAWTERLPPGRLRLGQDRIQQGRI
jgi:hypothetical protein